MAFAIVALIIISTACAAVGALADSKWMDKQLMRMKWWRDLIERI